MGFMFSTKLFILARCHDWIIALEDTTLKWQKFNGILFRNVTPLFKILSTGLIAVGYIKWRAGFHSPLSFIQKVEDNSVLGQYRRIAYVEEFNQIIRDVHDKSLPSPHELPRDLPPPMYHRIYYCLNVTNFYCYMLHGWLIDWLIDWSFHAVSCNVIRSWRH